ncbi:hypothetical protein PIB30_021099 [Stylosanthes scabra]|uniref:Uncharacterized protein n=1 Tax=Stylosanthes scabra TaxID=79078 RepID=A0ABU6Y9B3_9FABA|nr:hypothetical protein [Stylosanthes scabra]
MRTRHLDRAGARSSLTIPSSRLKGVDAGVKGAAVWGSFGSRGRNSNPIDGYLIRSNLVD